MFRTSAVGLAFVVLSAAAGAQTPVPPGMPTVPPTGPVDLVQVSRDLDLRRVHYYDHASLKRVGDNGYVWQFTAFESAMQVDGTSVRGLWTMYVVDCRTPRTFKVFASAPRLANDTNGTLGAMPHPPSLSPNSEAQRVLVAAACDRTRGPGAHQPTIAYAYASLAETLGPRTNPGPAAPPPATPRPTPTPAPARASATSTTPPAAGMRLIQVGASASARQVVFYDSASASRANGKAWAWVLNA